MQIIHFESCLIFFPEIDKKRREVPGSEGIPPGDSFAILYWFDDVRCRGLLLS